MLVLLMGEIYEICRWDAPGVLIYKRRFIKIGSGFRNMSGERDKHTNTHTHTHTHTQSTVIW
jgi:hypothetical protein